jgi:hypothetical protein
MTTPLPLPHQKKSLEMFVNPKAGKLTDYHNYYFFFSLSEVAPYKFQIYSHFKKWSYVVNLYQVSHPRFCLF